MDSGRGTATEPVSATSTQEPTNQGGGNRAPELQQSSGMKMLFVVLLGTVALVWLLSIQHYITAFLVVFAVVCYFLREAWLRQTRSGN